MGIFPARRTFRIAAAIVAATLATRALFAAGTLWAHDSVLYANALERGFHVDDELLLQRPHPPGYFFYVEAATLLHALGLRSNDALVILSAVATALTAAGIFLLTRRWVRDRVALVVAAAYAADPLVWQYSEIAYPYAVLALGSLTIAAACLWARRRGTRPAVVASIVFAVAGGFRQDLLVLLLPLWLWTVLPGRRRFALSSLAVLATTLLWLVPTVVLSGGAGEYIDALVGQSAFVRDTYSIFGQGTPAFVANVGATIWSLGWGLLAIAPFAIAAAIAVGRARRRARRAGDGELLLVWSLPPLAAYVVLQVGDWGYVLSALPGLYVLGARGLDRAITAAGRAPRLLLAGSWAALVVVPAALFVWTSAPFSAHAIAAHDDELVSHIAYVRANFPPRSTLILTREDYMLVRYYLPEYQTRQYDPDPYVHASRRMRVRLEHVVVMTAGLVPERVVSVKRVKVGARGVELVYFDVTPGTVLEFHGERYTLADLRGS